MQLRLRDYVGCYGILVGALLVSVQFRLELPYGRPLGAGYDPLPLLFYPLAALIILIALEIEATLFNKRQTLLSRQRGWTLSLTVLLAASATILAVKYLDRDFSGLQTFYFGIIAGSIALLTILLPAYLYPQRPRRTFWENLRHLWENRILLKIWTKYNVQSRYSQTILGIAWIVLLPLTTSLVLAFVFTQLMQAPAMDVPFVVFLLAGLVPWGLFSYGVFGSTRAIVGAMGIIGQIYFAREILVFVILGEGLVDFAITFVAMLIINALWGVVSNGLLIFVPAIVAIEIALMIGLMLIISSLSVMIRDIPPLISIVMQIMFYLTPILYIHYPPAFAILNLVNPLAAIVRAFRDVVIFKQVPDLVSLYYPMVISIILIYIGYTLFKRSEGQFADYL